MLQGVTNDRVAQREREIGQDEPPEGMPATEVLMLPSVMNTGSPSAGAYDEMTDRVRPVSPP